MHRHMSTQANGLVYGLIAIQFFLIFMHAWTFNWTDVQSQRYWDLNWERNLPTTFSMIQMALTGSVAITLAWLADIPTNSARVSLGFGGSVYPIIFL